MTSTGAARAALLPLLRDLNELKRVRPAPTGRSLAGLGFERAWAALAAGVDPVTVARDELDAALVATRLAGADGSLLAAAGLTDGEVHDVRMRARDAALARGGPWEPTLTALLRGGDRGTTTIGPAPAFATLLARQPRAPATAVDRARLSVEPPEDHAEHCYVVALTGVVIALTEPRTMGLAEPSESSSERTECPVSVVGDVFLAALAHHLHNAWLPDGGFAGEEALGEHLPTVVATLRGRALAELPDGVATRVDAALQGTGDDSTAAGRALHAADVIDRVLQTHHHADAAAFTVEQAMTEFGLVHEGPLQRYHHAVLAEIGL